jgi:D-tyrosyl-tRNA(Tyr) deacylase
MRAVIQRVSDASVHIGGILHARIGQGQLILLGIEEDDKDEDITWLVRKVCAMRIFSDAEGKMNLSIQDLGGEFLVISQFTLHASTKKGNRPSFIRAARPEQAIPQYEQFLRLLEEASGLNVKAGVFAADMQVSLTNNGPVTILIDSKTKE